MEGPPGTSSSAAAMPASSSTTPAVPSSPSPSPSSSTMVTPSSVAVPDGSLRNPSLNAGLARDASTLFNSSRYNECIDLLHQILLSYHENPKVIHNITVAEYFRDGCTDPQKLLHLLSKIKNKIEELCKTNAREQLMDANASSSDSPPTSAAKSGSKSGAVGTSSDTRASLEDYDTSIPTFNSAVVYFHLQQFAAALSVLEPLYHNIEVIDEPAALRICSLMLDTALASCQPRKASEVLRYMERVFGLGNLVTPLTDLGSTTASQPTLLSSTLDSSSNVGSAGMAGSPSISNIVPEASLTMSSSEEALDEEDLTLGGLDMEGGPINSAKAALGAPISSVLSSVGRGGPDGPSAAPQRDSSVKLLLHLNKIRFFLCTRNVRAAKKEVKLAMNLAQGGDHLKALMLKAQLEYLRGNHRKAIKLLMTCNARETVSRSALLNNLGCIHHHLRKYSTAFVYFQKAFQVCKSAMSAKPLLLSAFSQDKSASVLYNCGLQQLTSGNPILAARCFQQARSSYNNQPLFWLRLAECCICALEKGLLEAGGFDSAIKKDELRVMSIGDGRWRRLLLPAGSLNPSAASNSLRLPLPEADGDALTASSSATFLEESGFSTGKPLKLSLFFARQCLQNASHLVSKLMVNNPGAVDVEEADVSEDMKNLSLQSSKGTISGASQAKLNGNSKEGKVNSSNVILASVITFEEDQQRRYSTMLQHILADLAFMELCLDNPVKALKIARLLLQRLDITKPFTFLGHMYAAEALCVLNRLQEAANELATCITECNNPEMPVNGGDEDGQKWKSGENSEASGEGEDSACTGMPNASMLSEALSISSFTGTRARASLFINLAMVHVMLQDLSQAHRFATQAVSIMPASPLAVLSLVYVSLVQGRRQEAVALLKHCRRLCVKSS